MGEHEWRCDACGQTYVYFNSRGNRHCPACREAYRQQWAENIEQDLLPVPYHHLMLTASVQETAGYWRGIGFRSNDGANELKYV
ncbi:MAG: transposase zinc-binding domain-containing protein, partial [Pirellulaceae bacterium]